MDQFINSQRNQELLQKLLFAPDTVDFVVRRSEFFEELIENNEIAVSVIIAGRYAISYANRDVFESISDELGSSVVSIASFVLGLLDKSSLDASGITQVQQQPFLNLRGQGVIVGIVDTGIDYTLPCFRYEDGSSKIISIYDMTKQGNPPAGAQIGFVYTNEEINSALSSNDPLSIVPETDTVGHGTFLASVAAGREIGNDFIGVAPDAELIIVKLPKARQYYLDRYLIPKGQENAFSSTAIMGGIEYILSLASQLRRPVAICLGLGTNLGSHDGFSIFDEYLNGVANLRGVCLCVAAGNESQARHHSMGLITGAGLSQNIDIRVGENAGDIYLSVWAYVADKISVSVRSPTGELVERVPAITNQITRTRLILEKATVEIEYFFPIEGEGGQMAVIKIINATPGIWTVTVYGDIILNGIFHSWLPITGFVNPSVEFLSSNPYYTVVVPIAWGAITIGAYNAATNSIYLQSSWGPIRTERISPDFVAPGVGVSGFYPYGQGTMDGTSVATAFTTGAAALMLEWGVVKGNNPSLSTYQIRAFMIRGCERSPAISYPNNQAGYGRLNLLNTFQLMRQV